MDCTKLPSLVYFFIQLFPFCSFYFLFFLVFWLCNFKCQYFMSAILLSVHLVAYLKMPKNNGVRTLGEQQVSTTTLRLSRCSYPPIPFSSNNFHHYLLFPIDNCIFVLSIIFLFFYYRLVFKF